MTAARFLLACFFLFAASNYFSVPVDGADPGTRPEPSDWAEGSSQYNDGANREFYNRAAILPWDHFMGDWSDAMDEEQGDVAYALAEVIDDDTTKPIRWDVKSLVEQWLSNRHPNQGFFLRVTEGNGKIVMASRENGDKRLRPVLKLTGDRGAITLEASADTYLTPSTYRTQGENAELRVTAEPAHLLVRFDLGQASEIGTPTKAELQLHTIKQYGGAEIGVFRCRQGHYQTDQPAAKGIASHYVLDRDIADDPAVIFATDFESGDWQSEWSVAEPKDKIDIVDRESRFQGFESLQGKALRSRIAKGSTTALNTSFKFGREIGSEPEAVFFRYYLRLADDWNQTVQGGKLPGISGTYGRVGWGGRKSDGINGWSARGLFRKTVPEGNPLSGTTPVGFYCYHADMEGRYGTNWVWNRNYLGYLNTNRWYCIEQYCRLNTPGEKDGVLRAWIDGQLAFEKTDVRFRLTDKLKIEQVWMNVYHGGTIPSPYDQHVFIDNVVIARQYIGPIKTDR